MGSHFSVGLLLNKISGMVELVIQSKHGRLVYYLSRTI